MRMNKQTTNILFNQIQGLRKISRLSFTLEELQDWCHTLNKINSLEHGISVLNGFLLEDYEIWSALSDMVMPSRIGVETIDLALNLKSKVYSEDDDLEGAKILSPVDFNLMMHKFGGCFRLQEIKKEKISVLRKESNLSSIISRAYANELGLCKMSLEPYYPVALSQNFYKSGLYTETVEDMVSRWFQHTLINNITASK